MKDGTSGLGDSVVVMSMSPSEVRVRLTVRKPIALVMPGCPLREVEERGLASSVLQTQTTAKEKLDRRGHASVRGG